MLLIINQQPRAFMSIQKFRACYNLPDTFGVAYFMPKDETGMGSIERAGTQLTQVRHQVLNAVPPETPQNGWLTLPMELQRTFKHALVQVNEHIGLKPEEIDYAVAGFGEVIQRFVFELMSAIVSGKMPPSFHELYLDWLSSAIHLSSIIFQYPYHDDMWRVQLLKNPYGRVGMVITTREGEHYVRDAQLGCPAESYMASLMQDVSTRIATAVQRAVRRANVLAEA